MSSRDWAADKRKLKVPISDYTPTAREVGSLVRSRTTDGGGNEIGTFSDTTRPTNTQVSDLINEIVGDLYATFGSDIPDAPNSTDPTVLRKAAKRAAAYGAASMVELSFFPEQVATGRSPYKMYDEKYERAKMAVSKAISEVESGDTPGNDSNAGMAMFDGFPVDEGGMVGWNSVW